MSRSRFFTPNAIILAGKELQQMRAACRLAADTLEMISEYISPGITTEEINTIVHDYTIKNNAYPAPLGYGGGRNRPPFPKSVCTSVNNIVCHGIPGSYVLKDGDIVNVDVTSILPAKKGFFGDTSATFYVGEASPMAKHVVEVARESLELGILQVKPGGHIGDIGHAIQTFAESKGCAVVRDYTGHGIGRRFHGPPSVPHYGSRGIGPRLRKGMTFTIEPMINLRSHEVDHLDDGWTVVTADGGYSAQFEHTIVVTNEGCDVLTRRLRPLKNSEDKSWSRLGEKSCYIQQTT
jgi:methionyl aminopeptidase